MIDRRGSFRRAAIVAALGLLADQATKALARAGIQPGGAHELPLGIDLVRVANDGIAFGLFDGVGAPIVLAVAAAFALLLGYFLLHSPEDGLWLPIGLLAGGALGNLVDRVRDGSVTDFIDPPNWPAFNVADIEITVGVIILLWIYMRPREAEDAPA